MGQSRLDLGYSDGSASAAKSSTPGSLPEGWKRPPAADGEGTDAYFIESPARLFTIARYKMRDGVPWLYVLWERKYQRLVAHQDGAYDQLLALWLAQGGASELVEGKE